MECTTCQRGFEVQVCKSAAGFYIGTKDEDGAPNCRISGYHEDFKGAALALMLGEFERHAPEIEYCNGGGECF